jgi:cytidylate kinase
LYGEAVRGTITISRSYGAGGLRVAEAVSKDLGWRMVDREVVEQAARRLGLEPELAESLDERVPDLIEEAGLALSAAELPMGFGPPPPEDHALAEAVRAVIAGLADRGGYVIVGRGGQVALRARTDAVHVQLVGDLEERAGRIAEWQGLSEPEARELCRRVDEDRKAYVRRFHGVDIDDPLLYDVVLNTSRLGIRGAADAVLAVARARLGRGS